MITIDIVNQLIPNPITMLVQLISTLVLFLLVRKFLWKSIQNFMNARGEKMQEDLNTSEKAKNEALLDRNLAKEELQNASQKSEEIVSAAVKEAKSEKETILSQANKEAESYRKKAEEQMETKRQEMYQSVQREMVEVAMSAAEKLIQSKSSEEMDREAIDAFVKEVTANE
ncbi:MAG: F0F1 ATP synthase subunit B [Solobacterium sp.]|nr:F0F1 ATP synthase subunit B [Solobacterium sp.]